MGTGDWVAEIILEQNGKDTPKFCVVSNPEFLREGSAINDFMIPDRVVLGSSDREAAEKVAELYEALRAPIMITDLRTAEMIKYASNAFLATRISFINEMANICNLGADVGQRNGHGQTDWACFFLMQRVGAAASPKTSGRWLMAALAAPIQLLRR